ncbi:MAG: 4'-phosphopantetheinyl transferase superfamily protein [Gammaproteobacteria bacterium]|nr:4'-phosphopantetheinyl transferase superfamily protein [Gammaproteobacteria bacterium]
MGAAIQVGVYFADARLFDTPDGAAGFDSYLTPIERIQIDAGMSRKRQRQFVVSRVLARTALSTWSGLPAATWEIVNDRNGQPRACSRQMQIEPPAISLSHSGDYVVVAVSDIGRVGVDVEQIRVRAIDALADEILTPSEREFFDRQSDAERLRTFYRFWTLKEAGSKALGLGLEMRLRDLMFAITDGVHFCSRGLAPATEAVDCFEFFAGVDAIGALVLFRSAERHARIEYRTLVAPGQTQRRDR